MRMASEMLRPHVVSFLDIMLRVKNRVYRIEQAAIHSHSKFSNISLHEANIPQKTGLIVIAIKDSETGHYVYNPKSDFILKTGDVLIILGNLDQVAKLREYTGGKVS
jgi:voltage-gated potassium channel